MTKKIEFKVGKDTIRGKLFIPEGKGPFPGVIFFHGSGGKGEKYFEAGKYLLKKDILSLVFNYRGCGLSDGNYLDQIQQDSFDDALKAFSFLNQQKLVDNDRLGVVGGSYGGYVAAMILPKLSVKSLILLSPSAHDDSPTTKIDMGPIENEVAYFKDVKNWKGSQCYDNVSKFNNFILIIKSEHDENVPSAVVDKYIDSSKNASKKKEIMLKGADHRLSTPKMRNDFFELLSDWFLETL